MFTRCSTRFRGFQPVSKVHCAFPRASMKSEWFPRNPPLTLSLFTSCIAFPRAFFAFHLLPSTSSLFNAPRRFSASAFALQSVLTCIHVIRDAFKGLQGFCGLQRVSASSSWHLPVFARYCKSRRVSTRAKTLMRKTTRSERCCLCFSELLPISKGSRIAHPRVSTGFNAPSRFSEPFSACP